MIINSLEPLSVVLANLYLVMLLQVGMNWADVDCATHSNVYQLVFILTLVLRLFIQEAYNNRIIAKRTYTILMLLSSGAILTGLTAYQSYVLASNWSAFSYDPQTKVGDLGCYQNRIVFVAELVVGLLTVGKDIGCVIWGKEEAEEAI
jgi:hypothetical protein